ncbi:hypothetical protein M9H77_10427 [Catharanthus roseus]|uniref:Uncharacterized protein n=1 Tax=Catharanthus roseus TaxID=4058 RepID=A0ACC0C3E0_CATRO|nr:hypothetical protein M9H77_10427 [Catharanthus roseus]
MIGTEYTLSEVMEPHLFVIRKQKRDGPEKVTPMLTYYILDGSIYQAPQLCNVFAARLIDTKDILFICGGAFVDLEKTISERLQDSSIGFGAPVRGNMRSGLITNAAIASSLLESDISCSMFAVVKVGEYPFQVESSDLIAYGLIPEFVGRFPILVNLSGLTEDQLVQFML